NIAIIMLPDLIAFEASTFSLMIWSTVLRCFLKPAWKGSKILFFSRNHLSLLHTSFSMTLHMLFVREIGRYELNCPASLVGFNSGITWECFQEIGREPDCQESFIRHSSRSMPVWGRCNRKELGM